MRKAYFGIINASNEIRPLADRRDRPRTPPDATWLETADTAPLRLSHRGFAPRGEGITGHGSSRITNQSTSEQLRKCRPLRVPAFGAQSNETEDIILNDVTLTRVTEAALEGVQVFPHESSLPHLCRTCLSGKLL